MPLGITQVAGEVVGAEAGLSLVRPLEGHSEEVGSRGEEGLTPLWSRKGKEGGTGRRMLRRAEGTLLKGCNRGSQSRA